LVKPEDIPIGEDVVRISAKKGEGMDQLLKAIESALGHSRHHVVVTLPYSMGGMVETLHSGAQVLSVDYTGEGIVVEAILDPILYGRLKEYITKEL
jgi:GTP-binding protein HflX